MSQMKNQSLAEIKQERRKNMSKTSRKNDFFHLEDIYEKSAGSRLMSKLKTGLIFDERFNSHECTWDLQYPENPKRYQSVMEKLKDYDLVSRCLRLNARHANREEIVEKHDVKQLELLESTSRISDATELESLASRYDAIYFNEHTYEAALLAAGSAIELVKAVVGRTVQNGLAVVRPPGHHAMRDQYCGYCYFNNVALAANHALQHLDVKRILIVDWDVHHGQATQQMFYDDPRVVYFSIHRYEHGTFWPNLKESNFNYTGTGLGTGFNINVPLNETGCGDVDYLAIFHTVLLPLVYEFNPNLVLISAGYDAAVGCPEFKPQLIIVSAGFDSAIGDSKGEMRVSPGCYYHLTSSLMALAGGNVAVILEGGYFTPSLSEGVAQTLKALLHDPAPTLQLSHEIKPSVLTSVYNVISVLQSEWHCFKYIHAYKNIEQKPDLKLRKIHRLEIRYDGKECKAPFLTRSCYPVHTADVEKVFQQQVQELRTKFYHEQLIQKIGYCYDQCMELHKSSNPNNFERPERLQKVIHVLRELDIIDRMEKITCRPASVEEIETVHTSDYINKIKNIETHSENELKNKEDWSSVFTNEHTLQSSLVAAGSLMELVRAISMKQISAGVGIIRPPGHHAEKNAAGGFCIFNNVAIAAKYAILHGFKRVLIVDIDVHHGNGIQRTFYNDPKVLYISLHRYDFGKFFPKSTDANFTQTGIDSGLGYNVNIAWNSVPMSDADYITAFTRVVLPIGYEYNPELVLVAAGFDACKGDPLGGYKVSPEAFGHMIHLLKPLANGRIILALEGGYNVHSVGYSLAMCCKALLGDPLPTLDSCTALSEEAVDAIQSTIRVLSDHWHSLIPDVIIENHTI